MLIVVNIVFFAVFMLLAFIAANQIKYYMFLEKKNRQGEYSFKRKIVLYITLILLSTCLGLLNENYEIKDNTKLIAAVTGCILFFYIALKNHKIND